MPNPKLIGRGGTADVFTWGGNEVLKLFFDWVPQDWILSEAEITQRISESELPSPKFIGTTTYLERRGIIYERVEGISMLRLISSKPWLINSQAKNFARLHAQINQESGEGLTPLRARIAQKINNIKFLPEPIKKGALEILDQLPDGGNLCHYDFHPDQVMVAPRSETIIDWMSALQGVPEADVAHTANLLTLARPPKTNWVMEKAIDAARGTFFRVYKAESLKLRPHLKWEAVEQWRIPMAAARLHENITGEREAFLNFLRNSIEK